MLGLRRLRSLSGLGALEPLVRANPFPYLSIPPHTYSKSDVSPLPSLPTLEIVGRVLCTLAGIEELSARRNTYPGSLRASSISSSLHPSPQSSFEGTASLTGIST